MLPRICHLALLLPLALSLSATSCVDPSYGERPFACAVEGRCPDGYRCLDGVCRAEVAGVGQDAAPADQGSTDQGSTDQGLTDQGPTDQGPTDQGPGPDAVDGAGLPNDRPFGAPQPVSKINALADDLAPSLTADMLEIYFASSGGGGPGHKETEIWYANRASATGSWGSRQRVTALSSSQVDTTPEVSADGLILFLASDRQGTLDLYVSTRGSRGASWATPTRVSELSSTGEDASPSSHLGLEMVLASSRDGGVGQTDLYATSRTSLTASWSAPTALVALNTASSEDGPWLARDGTVIYFASDRPGGKGGTDIWRASRTSASGPFGPVVAVKELNSSSDDGGCWVSPDGSTIYFASDRGGAFDIFVAER